MSLAARLRLALIHASHSGFPWAARGADGYSPALRRAVRKSVVGLWPPAIRPIGQCMMILLWPVESLLDALVFTSRARIAALGGRSRLGVALRAWEAALRWNLPPVDYLAYRLFEPDRPGPGHWLHSAESHIHFSAIVAPEVRDLAQDKLAFARFAEAQGVPVVRVLAAYGPAGTEFGFEGGAPPQCDLIVKPRRGFGGAGHVVWRWDGVRHVADEAATGVEFLAWIKARARSRDVIVQAVAQAPARLGPVEPSSVPRVSVITAAGPGGELSPVFVFLYAALSEAGEAGNLVRLLDSASGATLPPAAGQRQPVWTPESETPEVESFTLPDWPLILRTVEALQGALPGRAPVLKWDILLTREGPQLLEVNTGTGVFGPQSMTLTPLTATALGPALEAWAE